MADELEWMTGGQADRAGMARYLHLIRAPDDPERLTRAEARAQGAGFDAWKEDLKGEATAWADQIVELLSDGVPRTFNRIVLELTGRRYTADVALGKPPDDGLWLAVGARYVEHTATHPVLFRLTAEHRGGPEPGRSGEEPGGTAEGGGPEEPKRPT